MKAEQQNGQATDCDVPHNVSWFYCWRGTGNSGPERVLEVDHYVVAFFCPAPSLERCKEFEGELTSIREDMIDVMDGDGWVVKLMDSPLVEEYAVGKTDQPVIVMFRNGLPVIYDGM